jgi:hypothetical protein
VKILLIGIAAAVFAYVVLWPVGVFLAKEIGL